MQEVEKQHQQEIDRFSSTIFYRNEKREIGNNGPVDISVVAMITNALRRLTYLEKEISFSRSLRFFTQSYFLFDDYSFLFILSFFFDHFIRPTARRLRAFIIAERSVCRDKPQISPLPMPIIITLFADALILAVYQGVSIKEGFAFITRTYLDNLDNRHGITRF